MSIPALKIDHDGPVPVYKQIAEGVMQAAADGRLQAGQRLPPTRDLARQLGVNRQTVVAAYDYLAEQGRVQSHTGRGTFLTTPATGLELDQKSSDGHEWWASFSRAVDGPGVEGLLAFYRTANAEACISFAGSYPARDLLPVDRFSAAMQNALADRGAEVLVYGPTAGHGPLRESIAARMIGAGSRVDPEEILITNGAQQAIELVFHTFLERGDPVIIEEPTYTGALSVLRSLGARVIGIPMDREGIRPDLLAIALERHRPKLMYVQPTFQNPTTAVMSSDRRREVLDLARRNRCLIVEDDWADGLRFEGDPLPSLHAMDPERRVIYLNTFSKKLLPGLRVGWVAAPEEAMQRLLTLKQIRDCGTSPLLQAALHTFLENGDMERHLQRVLPAYRQRRDTMLESLRRHLPRGATWTHPQGGLFLWVGLHRTFDGAELFRAAGEQGVVYSNGEVFHGKASGSHTLRLTFSAVVPRDIEAGVATLGTLVRERWPDRDIPQTRKPVEPVPIL